MTATITRAQTAAVIVFAALMPGLALSQNSGRPVDSLRLDQVIAEVLRHNDRAAAARYMEQSARSSADATGRWDDPMLMLGVQNVPTSFDFKMDPMTMKMVGISQSIPYSGYKGLERKAALAKAEASSADRRTTEVDLVTAAKNAYFDLYFTQQNLTNLEHQQGLLKQVIESATAKLRSNQAGQDEVLAAQTDLWRLQSVILSTQQEADAARYNLNTLRGVDPASPLPPLAAPPIEPVPDSASTWLQTARASYPQLKRLESQAESYRLSAASSTRMSWPMLNLQASYGFRSGQDLNMMTGQFENRDNMVSFQANISLPIFSFGGNRNMARSMQAMRQSSLAEAQQLTREIESDILALHARAKRLSESADMYRNRIIPADEDAYRSGLAAYAANRIPFTSLLSYETAIYRDRLTATQTENDLARTMAEIQRYTTDPGLWDAPANRK